jgi:hypothetical protein
MEVDASVGVNGTTSGPTAAKARVTASFEVMQMEIDDMDSDAVYGQAYAYANVWPGTPTHRQTIFDSRVIIRGKHGGGVGGGSRAR